jgi:hypothetical protein
MYVFEQEQDEIIPTAITVTIIDIIDAHWNTDVD